MAKTEGHSDLPWIASNYKVLDKFGNAIAVLEDRDDAEFTVRAANGFYKLTEALAIITCHAEANSDGSDWALVSAIKQAKEVLKEVCE